jgi:hypothetical protein
MNRPAKFMLSIRHWRVFGVALSLLLASQIPAGADSAKPQMAGKWARFEHSFHSAANYANPLTDIRLDVVFTSPLGDTYRVNGFWNGGLTWQVRFSPDMPGKWRYRTICSDTTDDGLNNVMGEFLCIAPTAQSDFDRHGPVQMSRFNRRLEHDDLTPFFWLADTSWNGALASKPAEWAAYAKARAADKFTAVQWAAPPVDQNLDIDAEAFRKLDAKVEAMNHEGILDAIVPLAEIPLGKNLVVDDLPEDKAIIWLRYLVARWGADDVVWIMTCDSTKIERTKRIGRAVFGAISHAPVILYAGDSYFALNAFRSEPWVNIIGYQTGEDLSDDALEWSLAGPVTQDWEKQPTRPFVNLVPAYEGAVVKTGNFTHPPISAQTVRRAAYWNALNTLSIGVSYGAQGIWHWENDTNSPGASHNRKNPTVNEEDFFTDGAHQMGILANFFNSIDFTRLLPSPDLIINQPGATDPGHYIAAARSVTGDLAVIYIPEGGKAQINLNGIAPDATATWIDPRSGARFPATITKRGQVGELSTPTADDWIVLINTAGK